jgi:hypothetical protein
VAHVREALQRLDQVVADAHVAVAVRIHDHARESEAARLESVVAVHAVHRLEVALDAVAQQVGRERLRVRGELRGELHRERRIADADLDRAEFGLRAGCPSRKSFMLATIPYPSISSK